LDKDGHLKLTDFGLSKLLVTDADQTHTFCGSPEYLAPEVLIGQGHGQSVDFWCLGILLFEMMTGMPPFYSENQSIMYQNIMKGKLHCPSYFSPRLVSLLNALLERDVTKRLGAKGGAKEVMQHSWFADIDWAKLVKKEVEPIFKPFVGTGSFDVANFDSEFTEEQPVDSFAPAGELDMKVQSFTFQGESMMG
jgi:serum/glucocorticoid-regulated kinase 2